MTIPINGTMTNGKSGTSSFKKVFIEDLEGNVDDWSCCGEETTLKNNSLSSNPFINRTTYKN